VILLALLALSGQSPAQGFYTPFSPQETLNVDFIASWGDGNPISEGKSVAVKEGYIYLGTETGLYLLDGRFPADSLPLIPVVETLGCGGVYIIDTLLIASGGFGFVVIYNISQPDNPVRLSKRGGNLNPPKNPASVTYFSYNGNGILFITWGAWNPLYIYDISDPTEPQMLSEWCPSPTTGIYQVAFYPPCYLYASSNVEPDSGWNVLYILDVSDPSNPYAIDSLVTGWWVGNALEVYDHYLYCGGSWVTVWDISDPLNPTFVYGALPLTWGVEDYFLNPQNRRLYLVSHLYVMSLSDPAYPIRVGEWHDTEYWNFSVFYDNGYIYTAGRGAADHSIDLYILHYLYDTIPEDTGNPYLAWIQTIYGNPGLRFSLKQESQVSFSLFNAAGQRAYQEDLGLLGPGLYTITLPGGLNPGVYVLFLKTNEKSSNRKIIFTKGGN